MNEAPKAVLDASALVALVLKERGADTVERIVRAGVGTTTPTGMAEAMITCERKGYRRPRVELYDDLLEVGLQVEPLVEGDALEMAFLLARSDDLRDDERIGRLSLGDAACLAVAHRLGLPAVVSDGTWELLGVAGLQVRPFR